MEMQFNKIIRTIFFLCLFISCKNDAQEKNNSIKKTVVQNSRINFFQKADKELYTMIIDESDISDHPILSYLNCENEGYFTIHFVPKSDSLRAFWQKDFFKNYDFNNFNLENDDKYIRQKLENKNKEYNIFSFQIKKEYLSSNNGCTVESIYPEKGSIADIYWYNQEKKVWELLKKVDANFLPPYANTDFFISHFSNLFPNQKRGSKNVQKIVLNVKGENLVISKGSSQHILKNVIKNEMSLTSNFKIINNDEFFIYYEANASVVKSVEKYIFSYKNGELRLLSKEIIKFSKDGIANNFILYEEKLVDSSYNYDVLIDLGSEIKETFSKNPVKKITYRNSKKINETDFENVSSENYFLKHIN